jgi:hypothetical protein
MLRHTASGWQDLLVFLRGLGFLEKIVLADRLEPGLKLGPPNKWLGPESD